MCILNEVKSTEHALVVLEVLEVEGGDRGASVFHAGPTHFCCEEPTRTGIDALPFGEFGVGDWVRGAHRHASPGRVISVRTQRTVLLAGERLIVSPTIGRALVDAEVSCGVSKGVLKSADNITRSCTQTCSSSLFADNSTGLCVEMCPTSPDYYGFNRVCYSPCPVTSPVRFAENTTRTCMTICPNGSYADSYIKRCVENCTGIQYGYTDNV